MKIKQMISQGKKASDFAVLMRVNALSRSFEQEFLKYNIPYKVFGGFKFFDRKEIKDLTAYLRIITNPLDNEAILRVINLPRRGIGDKTIDAIKEISSQNSISVFDVISRSEILPVSSSARSRVGEFYKLIYDLTINAQSQDIATALKQVIEKTAFLSQFEEQTEENESKKLNVYELVNSAEEFQKMNPNSTLEDYLSSITLSADIDEFDQSNFVTVATVHSVKGLEFDSVFIVGLDETIFPISRATDSTEELEEERRLMYVAITRAKKNLFLTRAKSRYLYGNRNITIESRFISEIKPLLTVNEPFNRYSSYVERPRYQENKGQEYGYFADEPQTNPFTKTKSFSTGYSALKTAKKLQTPSSSGGAYKSGTKVIHKKFGRGTVIAVKDDGKVIDVAFQGFGIKSLAVAYAPIEIES